MFKIPEPGSWMRLAPRSGVKIAKRQRRKSGGVLRGGDLSPPNDSVIYTARGRWIASSQKTLLLFLCGVLDA